jgi:hypothetical protein
VLSPELVVTMSSRRSPFKSATAEAIGSAPTAILAP